ncbi:hypothetical protein PIB30_015067 [Stylosanthes scabra]|uniref:Uncharacterized protein n=1 Tax=Stylosanthes scabra TaxID=79078 RepID=A0ABU6Q6S3_9FABA|nr:hypothetical protein [Stylosanthes scabra]
MPSTEWERATYRHVSRLIARATSGTQTEGGTEPLPDVAQALFSDLCPPRVYVPSRDWSSMAQWKCRQITLHNLCGEVGRSPPSYRKQTSFSTTFGTIHHFFVLIPPAQDLEGIPAAGRFSKDEYLAIEDAASSMITMLLFQTRKHLDDYNYDQIAPTQNENAELQ